MQMRKIIILYILFLTVFISCATLKNVEQNLGYTVYSDIVYGSDNRHIMDISIPDNNEESLNVILYIHGGHLMSKDKSNYINFMDKYRKSNIVASMNYRYVDDSTIVADLVNDVGNAIAGIKKIADEKGSRINKLILIGHSAGAHLLLLYAYQYYAESSIPIAFCLEMSGPTDLSDVAYIYNMTKQNNIKYWLDIANKYVKQTISLAEVTENGFSENAVEGLKTISAINFINKDVPPTIIVHDVADITVPYSNAASLHAVLSVFGVKNDFIASYKGLGHNLGYYTSKGNSWGLDGALEKRILVKFDEYMELYSGR